MLLGNIYIYIYIFVGTSTKFVLTKIVFSLINMLYYTYKKCGKNKLIRIIYIFIYI